MHDPLWWQHGVIYQIYPRSFQDSNADGVGDLAGVIERLDYLVELGVHAIWISPIYPSPMADFGYDVSDYCDVHPLFGDLATFDRLLAAAHARDLKVVLDFVPNHTSDQHPWFLESRSSRDAAKRDWYIWRDPAPGGGPPTNWISNFGGPAWRLDEATGQYYYHAFLPEQPDLNWRNPKVRRAMYDSMRFWLDRGVDGFRVDVIWHLIKDEEFRDNPPNPGYEPHQSEINKLLQIYSADQPEVQTVVREMREVIDAYPERVLIGEIYLPLERLVAYYGDDLKGAHLPFNFQLISATWRADAIAALVAEYEGALPAGGWPNWVLGNHDQPRIATRIGEPQTRVAAMLLLTLRGTPTLYYGDEIGLANVNVPPDRVQDPWETNEPGHGFGRDPQRTPMQWDDGPHAGFSTVAPWLPLSDDAAQRNVARLSLDPLSILNLYRRLIALRREHDALSVGDYEQQQCDHNVFSFIRRSRSGSVWVGLNMSRQDAPVSPPPGRLLLSTNLDRSDGDPPRVLRANEGVIVLMD
ncbi:MAG TPA: alpha-amylase family glycosyl hydrolase [Beijerinckiaceae bacterium]